MQLTLAWWNTALSPTRKRDRAEPAQLEVAAGVIRRLIEAGADLIVLCEVSERDIDLLVSRLGKFLRNYSVLRMQDKVGASNFDTALLHHRSLRVSTEPSIIQHHGSSWLRVAQKVSVTGQGALAMTLYLSHWPSRRNLDALSALRALYGHALRIDIADRLKRFPKLPLVVLGDFNDEPFDPSISEALLSSRDRTLVERRRHLLYNPFWRHMTSYDAESSRIGSTSRGTYFHSRGDTTRWRTFDQMLFSASLLTGESGWLLDEKNTCVVHDHELAPLLRDRASIFDHLPILGRIFRRPSDE